MLKTSSGQTALGGLEKRLTGSVPDDSDIPRPVLRGVRLMLSGGALTFNFASLYATLYKLEERKWIQGRWVEKAGQRRRRYYKITPEGREVLAAQRKEWRQFFELIRDLAGVRYA